jgi:hypothetical protein
MQNAPSGISPFDDRFFTYDDFAQARITDHDLDDYKRKTEFLTRLPDEDHLRIGVPLLNRFI